MPQFDISSFNVQLFWLFFSFITFYFILSWKFLPSSAFLLKTRKKPLALKSKSNLNFEDYKTLYNTKTSLFTNNNKNTSVFFVI